MKINSRHHLTIQDHIINLIYSAGVSPMIDITGVLFDHDTDGLNCKLVIKTGPADTDYATVDLDLAIHLGDQP